jgi:hypothetical protein
MVQLFLGKMLYPVGSSEIRFSATLGEEPEIEVALL